MAVLDYTFTSKQIFSGVWAIDDHGFDTMYLIEGRQSALLIDTGVGFGNIREYIGTLTPLPIAVVNTHPHIDHAGGNYLFDFARIHPKDLDVLRQSYSPGFHRYGLESMIAGFHKNPEHYAVDEVSSVLPCKTGFIDGGQIIDLGGRHLEILETPGHTVGSICLLELENGLLFSGDTLNPVVWIHLDFSASLSKYLQTLENLIARHSEIRCLLTGHGPTPSQPGTIDDLASCAQDILNGTAVSRPAKTFAGQGVISKGNGVAVIYDPRRLK